MRNTQPLHYSRTHVKQQRNMIIYKAQNNKLTEQKPRMRAELRGGSDKNNTGGNTMHERQ